MDFHSWLYAFDLFGTFVFAISGALAGLKKEMDIFGVWVLAVVTSSGGGILRSVLIGEYPLSFLKDPGYLLVATIATILVFYGARYFKKYSRALVTCDAIGLSIFLSLGITVALENGLSFWASILLGVITAAAGGVIRDVLSAEVPLIFRKELYATAAFAGGLVYVALFYVGTPEVYTIIAASLSVFLIRELSIKYDLSLPR